VTRTPHEKAICKSLTVVAQHLAHHKNKETMTTGNNVHTTGQITALENKANAFTNTTRMIAHRRLQTD